jgi:sarcosine oxidase, subunit gamma
MSMPQTFMAIDARRKSALSHRQPQTSDDGSAALREKPFEGKLILRGEHGSLHPAVNGVLGADLPATVGGTASSLRVTAQWLGPDEWLLITPPREEIALLTELNAALAALHAQAVDVTDYYTTIELSGPRAREMLMKITTIDMHPRAFKVGHGVAGNFGRANPFVRQTRDDAAEGGPAFDLIIRISMADYLWCLLCEAGHEWGLIELDPKGQVKQHLPHFEQG